MIEFTNFMKEYTSDERELEKLLPKEIFFFFIL